MNLFIGFLAAGLASASTVPNQVYELDLNKLEIIAAKEGECISAKVPAHLIPPPQGGGDPGGPSFVFVQSGPSGCPAQGANQEPSFDVSAFPGCWLPPSQCPPLERAVEGGHQTTLPFADVPAGAPCLLVASPSGTGVMSPPCFYALHDVFELIMADSSGHAVFTINTPVVNQIISTAVPFAQVQMIVLDTSGQSAPPVLATSRVISLEVRP